MMMTKPFPFEMYRYDTDDVIRKSISHASSI